VTTIREKVAARDDADVPLDGGGGGGGGGVTPAGVGGVVPPGEAVTLMANFCPPAQCPSIVQM
jgi:hypothetical protein